MRFGLASLQRRRDKISALLSEFPEAPVSRLDADISSAVVDVVKEPGEYRVLNPDEALGTFETEELERILTTRTEAARSCLNPYLDRTLDESVRTDLCFLYGAWWDHIRAGKVYKRWDPMKPAKGLIRVMDLRQISFGDQRNYEISYRCEAGWPVLHRWKSTVTANYLMFLGRSIGFPKRESRAVPEDIMSTCFIAILHADSRGCIATSDAEVESCHEKFNKELYRLRKGKCTGPLQAAECGVCRYGVSECRLGRWAQSYTEHRDCKGGHMGIFRKGISEDWCLSCLRKGKYKWSKTG